MGNEETRRNRINILFNSINAIIDRDGSCPKNQLVAQFMLEFGTSRRTTMEYLKLLVEAGKFDETAGVLTKKELKQ